MRKVLFGAVFVTFLSLIGPSAYADDVADPSLIPDSPCNEYMNGPAVDHAIIAARIEKRKLRLDLDQKVAAIGVYVPNDLVHRVRGILREVDRNHPPKGTNADNSEFLAMADALEARLLTEVKKVIEHPRNAKLFNISDERLKLLSLDSRYQRFMIASAVPLKASIAYSAYKTAYTGSMTWPDESYHRYFEAGVAFERFFDEKDFLRALQMVRPGKFGNLTLAQLKQRQSELRVAERQVSAKYLDNAVLPEVLETAIGSIAERSGPDVRYDAFMGEIDAIANELNKDKGLTDRWYLACIWSKGATYFTSSVWPKAEIRQNLRALAIEKNRRHLMPKEAFERLLSIQADLKVIELIMQGLDV